VHHPETGDLVVMSGVDARREVPRPGGRAVEVLAEVRDAVAGLGLDARHVRDRVTWTADLATDGRVVAVLCGPQECWLRAQQQDGSWRTLAGGGTELPVEGADPTGTRLRPVEFLTASPRQPMVVDRARREVVLVTRVPGGDGARHGLVVVPLDGSPLRTPLVPGRDGLPDVDAWLQSGPMAMSPSGLVLLSAPSSAQRLRTVDTQQGLLRETDTFLDGGASLAEADDGTVWSGSPSWHDPAGLLARSVLETGEPAGGVTAAVLARAGARADGALLPVRDGVLVAGPQVPGAVHLVDVSPLPPLAPPGLRAVPGDQRATLSWTEADGEGLSITGYRVTVQPGGRTVQLPATARGTVLTGLTNGTWYGISVTASNAAGEGRAATTAVTPRDTTPPGPVRDVVGTPGVERAVVRWSVPSDADFAGVTVVHRVGRTAPTSPTDGRVVYRGSATQTTVTGLAQGQDHAVAVFSRDVAGNHGPRVALAWRGSSLTGPAPASSVVFGAASVHEVVLRRPDGTAVPGAPVELHVRARGSTAWKRVAVATTANDGRARVQHAPSWNAEYQLRHPGSPGVLGAVGPVRRVDVAMSVSSSLSSSSVRRGGTVALSGTVKPNHASRTVVLERQVGGVWQRAASQQLTSSSTYRFSIRRATAGTVPYRVVAPADADHARGVSATRTVRWT
jgi:hypothetical protein